MKKRVTKTAKKRTKEKKLPSVQTIYNSYVSPLKLSFQPTPAGQKAILFALKKGYETVFQHKEDVTVSKENEDVKFAYTDICPGYEVDYEGHCGAAFLSLCRSSLRSLALIHPFVLSVLIEAAKKLGVGEMLKRAVQRTCLFRGICAIFPELAIRLLHESQDSPMFPNLGQTVGKIPMLSQFSKIDDSRVIKLCVELLPEKFISDTIVHLLEEKDEYTMICLLMRINNDPGILLLSKMNAPKFIQAYNSQSFCEMFLDVFCRHSAYEQNIFPKLLETIGPYLLSIPSLCQLIKEYVLNANAKR